MALSALKRGGQTHKDRGVASAAVMPMGNVLPVLFFLKEKTAKPYRVLSDVHI